MTRERCRELLPVFEAYARGEVIECRRKGAQHEPWEAGGDVHWLNDLDYRVKPKPLEVWAVFWTDEGMPDYTVHHQRELAERAAGQKRRSHPDARVIHMREVEEGK